MVYLHKNSILRKRLKKLMVISIFLKDYSEGCLLVSLEGTFTLANLNGDFQRTWRTSWKQAENETE